MNNTNNDGKLYVLTAGHCLSGAGIVPDLDAVTNPLGSTIIFTWNYESPSCINQDLIPLQTTGATVVANAYDGNLDFALLELQESPLDENVLLYFNGWDRQIPTVGGVFIGHPEGDIKKIATYNSSPVSIDEYNYSVSLVSTTHGFSHIEHGSSGCPLYSNGGRVIGSEWGVSNLTGCSPQTVYSCKFSSEWNHSVDFKRQLAHWLDPKNTNPLFLDGTDCNINVNNPNYPTNTLPTQPTTVFGCSISATNTIIPSGANVVYHASNTVTLQSSFQVNIGSTFQIK